MRRSGGRWRRRRRRRSFWRRFDNGYRIAQVSIWSVLDVGFAGFAGVRLGGGGAGCFGDLDGFLGLFDGGLVLVLVEMTLVFLVFGNARLATIVFSR